MLNSPFLCQETHQPKANYHLRLTPLKTMQKCLWKQLWHLVIITQCHHVYFSMWDAVLSCTFILSLTACWINTELLCVPISSPADGSLYLYQLTTPSKCQTVSCQLPRQHLQNRNVTVSELSVYFISFWCHRKRTPVWRTPKLHNIYESNVQGFLTKHVFLLYYLFI